MTEVGEVFSEGVVVLDEVRNWQVERRSAFSFRPRIVNGPAAGGSLNKEWPSEEIQLAQRHNASSLQEPPRSAVTRRRFGTHEPAAGRKAD